MPCPRRGRPVTHWVAISNQRLLALDERGVTFRWKDYRATGKTRHKTMTLGVDEFMRGFDCTFYPVAFTASAAMGCSPMPDAGTFVDHQRKATPIAGPLNFKLSIFWPDFMS